MLVYSVSYELKFSFNISIKNKLKITFNETISVKQGVQWNFLKNYYGGNRIDNNINGAADTEAVLRGLEFGDYHPSSTDNLPKRQIWEGAAPVRILPSGEEE